MGCGISVEKFKCMVLYASTTSVFCPNSVGRILSRRQLSLFSKDLFVKKSVHMFINKYLNELYNNVIDPNFRVYKNKLIFNPRGNKGRLE